MITVTKAYLPNSIKYKQLIDEIYSSGILTNNGPLLKRLEQRLREYLGVKHLILVANGSIALQVAYKALNLTGEVITTPFSFAATSSTLVWEGLEPRFADIDSETFNINPIKIEKVITKKTTAILPVHVFGNPCDVLKIKESANKNGLKVIYDAAHAFGVKINGESVLKYGDISTLSFHATKIFHTCEGGALVTEDDDLAKRIRLLINFGITGPDKIEDLGTNAKMNELEAAMGLCVLDDIEAIELERKRVYERYRHNLGHCLQMQVLSTNTEYNYSYVPVLLENEDTLKTIQTKLLEYNIIPRRYFYPSLDTLSYLHTSAICPVSRDIASRILCLPTYYGLEASDVDLICNIVESKIGS